MVEIDIVDYNLMLSNIP